MISKCSLDKYNQEFIQKSNSLSVPVDPNKSFNPNLDSPTDLDDICTSISQVPINPLYIENPTSVSKIALPEGKLLEDDRFWGAQVEKHSKMINKPLDMLDNQYIIEFTSESVDSFTPNKKKEKLPGSITRWSVALIANNLVIVGNDSNGKRQITSCCRRISSNIFHDNNGVVCSLLGPSEPSSDLPKYISDKFKNGIPVDWQSVVITWGHFQSLGCPASYKWPTMSQSYSHVNNYETDTEIGQNQSTITVQQLRKKITKMQTRYRTMLFRESLLGSCTNSIHDSSLYLSTNVDIPCVNSNNKIITNVNVTSRSRNEIVDPKVHAVNNLLLRDTNIEVVSYQKKHIVLEKNSDLSESDTESEKKSDSLHLQIVSSGEETTNNPKVNKNQRQQQIKTVSKTNEDQLKVIPKIKDNLAKNNLKTNENQQIKVIPKTIENQLCKTNENLTKVNPKINESQAQINLKTNENQPELDAERVDGSKTVERIASESEMIFPSETKPAEEPKSANNLTISGSSSFVSVNFSFLSKVSSIKEVPTTQHTKDSKPAKKTDFDSSEHANVCFKHPKNIKNLPKNCSSTENNSPTTAPNASDNSQTNITTITDNTAADKEEFLKPATPKVVKKLGRPPKPKPIPESGATPKKRGRPPKNKSFNDKIPEQIVPDLSPIVLLTPVDITTLKKQERPSKNKSATASTSKSKDKMVPQLSPDAAIKKHGRNSSMSRETKQEIFNSPTKDDNITNSSVSRSRIRVATLPFWKGRPPNNESVTPKPKSSSPNKIKEKMVPQLLADGFLVPSSTAPTKKRGRNSSKSRETNQEAFNSPDLDSTKNRDKTEEDISECSSSNVSLITTSSVSRRGRTRVATLPFWKDRPSNIESVTETSPTRKPKSASPSKLKEKMVPQVRPDGFLVPSSSAPTKKRGRNSSKSRETNQEAFNLDLDSTKNRDKTEEDISECSSSTTSSVSRRGRTRVATLPFWKDRPSNIESVTETSPTRKPKSASPNKLKQKMVPQVPPDGFLVPSSSAPTKKRGRNSSKSRETNQEAFNSPDLDSTKNRDKTDEDISECSSSTTSSVSRRGRTRVATLPFWKDRPSNIESVTETSPTRKPKSASPNKLKEKMVPQLPPDGFLVPSSTAPTKKRGRNSSLSQEVFNSPDLDSTKNRDRKSALNSTSSNNVSLINNSSLSRSGRIRVPTLPFWKGHRLTTYKDETVIQRSVTEKCNISSYVLDNTFNDRTISKKNIYLSYDEVFHRNVQLTSTLRDSLINDSVINKTRHESPVRNKKTITQKTSEKQMSAKKQLNSAATETIDSCSSSVQLTNQGRSTNISIVEVPTNRNISPVKNLSQVKSTSKTKAKTQDSPRKQLSAKKQLTRLTNHSSTPIKPINRRRSKSRTESYSSEYEYEPEEKNKSPFKKFESPVKSVNKTQSKNQKQLTDKKQLTYPEKTNEHVEINENINISSRTYSSEDFNEKLYSSEVSTSEDHDDASYSSEDYYEPKTKTKPSVKNVKSPVKPVSKTQSKNQQSPRKQLTAKKQSTYPEKTTPPVETNENRKQLPIGKRARSIADVKNTDQKCDTEIQSPLRKIMSPKILNFDDSPALKSGRSRKETKNAKPENKPSKSTDRKRKNSEKLLEEQPLHTRRSCERRRSDINYNEKLMWVTNSKTEPQTAKKSKRKSLAENNFNFIAEDITSIEENIPRRSLENKKMGPKITTQFKPSKPKKMKKVVIPTDQNELFLFAAKTRKAYKKVTPVTRRPTPKKNPSKKRKLFTSNSWLQSDECMEYLSKSNPENDVPCPKFVLKFEPNIKMPVDDDDVFSEVSAFVKS